jgi:ArsR family transcriptional regulator
VRPHPCYEVSQDPCARVGELAEGLKIAPSTVSHHLKELRNVGLIRMEKWGRHVICSVDSSVLDELGEFLGRLPASCD